MWCGVPYRQQCIRKGVNPIMRIRRWLSGIGCIAAAMVLLMYPQAVQTGVRRGLAICGNMLIPSLFPFLVLSGFWIRSGLAGGVGRRMTPLMQRMFGFSGSAAAAMIIALIGGYPAGANAVAQLCEQGELDHAQAKRLLRCCVCAGPAFIIGGIGVGMLGSVEAGVRLLAAHWLAFIVVALTERQSSRISVTRRASAESVGVAVAQSVHAATQSLLSMCGFVLLASGVMSLLDALIGESLSPLWRCVLACVTEVSTGCVEAARMGRTMPFFLGAALGFGGLSVHGQIAARTASLGLLDRGFFRVRLLHALLGGCLSMLSFWRWMPPGIPSSAVLSAYASENPAVGMSGLVAMMLMCVLFLYTLPHHTTICSRKRDGKIYICEKL